MRWHVISAVFKRNLLSYFTGVIGYLFIVVFVVAGAYLAFNARFFTNNLANLDQLNEWFPLLLLFIVPAITMSVWADERKLGTAELLFTLPARDIEILLGKYFAVLAVYTVTLLFSLPLVVVLAYYADPDWGMLFTTYFGYWISGAALLSAGMVASVLTSSTTVAFVLGVAICAVPVFIGVLAPWSDFFRGLSLAEQFREFGMGMLPLSGILYFVSFIIFMLYLNLVFISERHWSGGKQANMGFQFVVRSLALAIILISANTVAAYGTRRIDMTAENLYTITNTTRDVLDNLDEKNPVTVQAFVSTEVPRDYVPVRKRLLGLLRQYDQLGGSLLDVRFVDVEPFSEEAEEAERFGIEAERVFSERDGRRSEEDVYLGVVVSSPRDEVVVPFFGAGMPIEYELTRSIGTVADEQRLTVGVLRTDAEVIGASREWQIVTELKKQYKVEEVSPDSEIDVEKIDVLLAVMPSSLTDPQLENFYNYVAGGHPTLIFDDPYPLVFSSPFGVSMAPRLPKPSPGGGMMGMNRQPPVPKGDDGKLTRILNLLEVDWENGSVVFDRFNPHPEFFEVVPPEYIFISPDNIEVAFSSSSEITRGLQEILAAFSGTVVQRKNMSRDFEPLLVTGDKNSGLLSWDELTTDGFDMSRMSMTRQLRPEPPRILDQYSHVVAAHITGSGKGEASQDVNVVFVSDLDLISDWFFMERSRADTSLKLDNVTFVLNAVDVLAGEDAYLDLRKRRPQHRTLKVVEDAKASFLQESAKAQEKADKEAEAALNEAKERFQKQIEELENDSTLDEQSKRARIRMIQAVEERKIAVAEANIEREKKQKIDKIVADRERRTRETERRFRFMAVTFAPMPAIFLGVIVLSMRVYNERRDITPERTR